MLRKIKNLVFLPPFLFPKFKLVPKKEIPTQKGCLMSQLELIRFFINVMQEEKVYYWQEKYDLRNKYSIPNFFAFSFHFSKSADPIKNCKICNICFSNGNFLSFD